MGKGKIKNITRLFFLSTILGLGANVYASTPDQVAQDNLKLWLDASDSSTVFKDTDCSNHAEDGDKVACWIDKRGNEIKLTNDNSDELPNYKLDAGDVLNHKSALYFNKSQKDHLIYALPQEWQGDATVFIVFEETEDGASTDSFFSSGDTPNDKYFQITVGKDDKTYVARTGPGSDLKEVPFEPEELNTLKLYSVKFDSSGIKTYADGKLKSSSNLTNIGNVFGQYRLNINRYNTRYSTAYIAEVIIYNKALNDEEMQKVQNYLGQKYGKDFSPPTIELN